jgi:hypothetical protein
VLQGGCLTQIKTHLTYFFLCLSLASSFTTPALTQDVSTSSIVSTAGPVWATKLRIQRVVNSIEKKLEWDLRRVRLAWYTDQASFQKVHGYGRNVLAVSRTSDLSIHIGPSVTSEKFDAVLGHELVHIILFQKYKAAIPKWLEEGLANYTAKLGSVNYKWLANQPFPKDVRTLVHPFSGSAPVSANYHYQASTALTEMIAKRCSLPDLLQLSVGKNLESYLNTFCEIKDINLEYKIWVEKKGNH